MSFTISLNKGDLLLLSGFGLLYQGMNLNAESKLMRDNLKLVRSTVELLDKTGVAAASPFKKLACGILQLEPFLKPAVQRKSSSENNRANSQTPRKSPKGQLQAIASRFSFNGPRPPKAEATSHRRSTMHTIPVCANMALYSRGQTGSRASLVSIASEPVVEAKRSPQATSHAPLYQQTPNLDYLPLGSESPAPNQPNPSSKPPINATVTDWEFLSYLDSFDNASAPSLSGNLPRYVSPDALSYSTPPLPADWSPEAWALPEILSGQSGHPGSVFSLSDESLTSGEDISSNDFNTTGSEYRGFPMPATTEEGYEIGARLGV